MVKLDMGMVTARVTHNQRERSILIDVEISFPEFAEHTGSWVKVPDGQDPPDFITRGPRWATGLELVEWLDGEQTGSAKTRESQREQIHRILARDWEKEYQPKNFCRAFPSPFGSERITRPDELPLRQEFLACAAEVDRSWPANPERRGNSYYLTEFLRYPLMRRYFCAIRYLGGEPHGLCWIGEQGEGGAFDPTVPVETLKRALDSKLTDYSTLEKQAHLKTHGLTDLDLLVHGGFNIYAYNTPAGHLTLEEIARRGADYYATRAQRHVFDRVWFFHSLETADDLNQLIGFPRGHGRVRWLAQLWPDFKIYSGSLAS
jgi:hypothetical protein